MHKGSDLDICVQSILRISGVMFSKNQLIEKANSLIWPGLCVVAFLVASHAVLFAPREPGSSLFYTHMGHSWDLNLWRINALAQSFSEGHRGAWLIDYFYGWGYPLFYYEGFLSYVLGGLLVCLGFQSHVALNLTWLTYLGLAVYFLYKVLIKSFKKDTAALLSVIYILSPQLLLNIFVRTSLNDTLIFVILPLLLSGVLSIDLKPIKKLLLISLCSALLLLNDLTSAYIVFIPFVFFTLCFALLGAKKLRIKRALIPIAGILLGAGISAFYWIPALMDLGYVQLSESTHDYSLHFVYLQQLYDSYWGYGDSSPGQNDYMSFTLGPIIAGLLALSLISIIFKFLNFRFLSSDKELSATAAPIFFSLPEKQRDRVSLYTASFLSLIFAVFLSTSLSSFIWDRLPLMEVVSFPWRFLIIGSFFAAISIGSINDLLLSEYKFKGAFLIPAALAATVIYLHSPYTLAGEYGNLSHDALHSTKTREKGVVTTSREKYLPRDVRYQPEKRHTVPVAEVRHGFRLVNGQIKEQVATNGYVKVELSGKFAGTLVVNQFWHPAWEALVDGQKVETRPMKEHPFAPIALDFNQNARVIEVYFGLTKWAEIGQNLSISTLAVILFCFLYTLVYKLSTSKENKLANALISLTLTFICFVIAGSILYYFSQLRKSSYSPCQFDGEKKNTLALSELSEVKAPGTSWNSEGTKLLKDEGVCLLLDKPSNESYVELSFDHNDLYRMLILSDDAILGSIDIEPVNEEVHGLYVQTVKLPTEVSTQGFNRIVILPISGDGLYSIGHVVIRERFTQHWQELVTPYGDVPFYSIPVVHIRNIHRSDVTKVSRDGTGNIILNREGILILIGKTEERTNIKTCVDSNDYYVVYFLNESEDIVGHRLLPPEIGKDGITCRYFKAPNEALEKKYTKVAIVPIVGDDRYSMSHFGFE